MERAATEVAKPPRGGGELPSFEELLAKGSFHARLARARADREKILRQVDDENDFVLDTRHKPWEKQDAIRSRRDPLVEALRSAAAARAGGTALRPVRPERAEWPGANVLVLWPMDGTRPGPAPAGAVPRRRAVAAGTVGIAAPAGLPDRLPARAPDATAGRLQAARRAAMAGIGFAAGLALGVAAAAILPRLVPSAATVAPPPVVAVAPAVPALALPDLGPSSVPASLSAPAIRTALPGLPVAEGREAALDPPARGVPTVAGTGPAQPPAVAAFDPVPERLRVPAPVPGAPSGIRVTPRLVMADPATGAVADRRPVFSATAPRPTGLDAAALSGGPEMPRFGPAAEDGTIASDAPARFVPPVATAALPPIVAEGADSAPGPQAVPPAAGPRFAGPVVVNAPASIDEAALAALVGELGAGGFVLAEPNRVDITIRESNVRFFHPGDAAAAEAVAAALGAVPRDFTAFTPAPPEGTIEVWLAGRGEGAAPARARRTSAQGSMTPAERELEALRARILQQLRNGEHL